MSDVVEITDLGFAAMRADLPILLDFSGSWCPPCRMIEPHLDAIASQYRDRVVVGRIDADQNPRLAERFSVHSLPTLIMLRDSHVVGQIIGAAPRNKIEELVESALR